MTNRFSQIDFIEELKADLSVSDANKRMEWAALIIEHDVDIRDLSELLSSNRTVAMRFSWLLSDIGTLQPNKLFQELPFLLKKSEQIEIINFVQSFATYWMICGVPIENESKAIDLLFQWIMSSEVNITTKSRSLKVLLELSKKYPELKNELSICLKDQIDKHSDDFRKKVDKALMELEQ